MTVTTGRRCPNPSCRRRLGETSRPDKVFCSNACRVTDHQRRRRSTDVPDAPELEGVLERITEETRLVAFIAAAAPKNRRASAWLLKGRYPERWAPRPRSVPEPEPGPVEDDPFREVDDLAARRRAKHLGRPRS